MLPNYSIVTNWGKLHDDHENDQHLSEYDTILIFIGKHMIRGEYAFAICGDMPNMHIGVKKTVFLLKSFSGLQISGIL